jgi:predicted O-methyltransferase YrrM
MALAKAEQSRRVIEQGTALGYTACCLADAVYEDPITLDRVMLELARLFAQRGPRKIAP